MKNHCRSCWGSLLREIFLLKNVNNRQENPYRSIHSGIRICQKGGKLEKSGWVENRIDIILRVYRSILP